jgi:16S rRNA (cytidine1402-2'-O)-methyltransferase
MPCISDPGYRLAATAHDKGITVITVPGASALVSAVAVSGLNSDSILFNGFLPSKKNERCKMLQSVASQQSLLVFYESPHRLLASLKDCFDVLGDRKAAVCKELTKIHEKCFRGRLSQIIVALGVATVKGEYVLVIEGGSAVELPPETVDLHELLIWYKDESGRTLRDSVQSIASDLGLSKSFVYSEALKVWNKD